MSQNSMPRKVVSGLTARMKPMSADQPEAMTTPVSSSRTAVQLPRRRASANTSSIVINAPAQAAAVSVAPALQYGPDAGHTEVDAADHQRKREGRAAQHRQADEQDARCAHRRLMTGQPLASACTRKVSAGSTATGWGTRSSSGRSLCESL